MKNASILSQGLFANVALVLALADQSHFGLLHVLAVDHSIHLQVPVQ